jgi:hypothetical protein
LRCGGIAKYVHESRQAAGPCRRPIYTPAKAVIDY